MDSTSPLHLLVKHPEKLHQVTSLSHSEKELSCTAPHARLIGVQDELSELGSNLYLRVQNDQGLWELQRVERAYKLRPRVEQGRAAEEGKREEEQEEAKKVMRQSLVNEFGTKKQKKKMAAYFDAQNDAQNVSTGKDVTKIVQKTVERETKQKARDRQEQKTEHSLLPAFSTEADSVQEFYDLHSIISPEEMEALLPRELESMLKKPKLQPKLHSYVQSLHKQVEEKHGHVHKREAQMLLYLNHLLMLYELKREIRGEISHIAERWKIPEEVVKGILEKFTERGVDLKSKKVKYVKGAEQQHKLVHFIIVLVLFLLDFEVEPSSLAKALAIKFKTLCIYLKRVFCKPVHSISKTVEEAWGPYTVARLQLPPK